MPKQSGQANAPIKHKPPLRPTPRPIKKFDPVPDGPHRNPPTKTSGSIDPRQQRY